MKKEQVHCFKAWEKGQLLLWPENGLDLIGTPNQIISQSRDYKLIWSVIVYCFYGIEFVWRGEENDLLFFCNELFPVSMYMTYNLSFYIHYNKTFQISLTDVGAIQMVILCRKKELGREVNQAHCSPSLVCRKWGSHTSMSYALLK